jgi:hypothetical protein
MWEDSQSQASLSSSEQLPASGNKFSVSTQSAGQVDSSKNVDSQLLALAPGELAEVNASSRTSWTSRNPHLPRITPATTQPRKGRLTDAQDKQQRAKANALRHQALMSELEEEAHRHEECLKQIADQHGRKIDSIRMLLGYSEQFKKKRKPNLYNAKIMYKARQLNEGTSDV